MNASSPRKLDLVIVSSREADRISGMTPSPTTESGFSIQRLSLDSAVSPLLPSVTAPFDRTERKKAHSSAVYYSECFLRGIHPADADSAAKNAQDQYDKWWIQSTAHHKRKQDNDQRKDAQPIILPKEQQSDEHDKKRRKMGPDDSSIRSSNMTRVASRFDSSISNLDETGERSHDFQDPTICISQVSTLFGESKKQDAENIKMRLIADLKTSGGNVETKEFLDGMGILEAYYKSKSWDGRGSCKATPFSLDGNWLTLSKPTYNECKGRNQNGELMYSLGRMSFGMFRPTNLVCSVQASFNSVRPIDPKNPGRPLHVPKKLMKEIQRGDVHLRTYDIVVAITIEAGQDRKGVQNDDKDVRYFVPKPIRGILTNQGYAIADPNVPNRLSIWFSGGALEVQDEPKDLEEWKRVFDATSVPESDLREYANTLAARLLLGANVCDEMEEDGTVSFSLKKPIGGHGSAYCDIVYMDDDMRIMRGHHDSVYVCTRVPEPNQINYIS